MPYSRLPAARLRVSLPILIVASSIVVMVATTLTASLVFYAQARSGIAAALTTTARDKATEFDLLLGALRTEVVARADSLSNSRVAENLVTGLRILQARNGPQDAAALRDLSDPGGRGARALGDVFGRASDAVQARLFEAARAGGFPDMLFVEPGGTVAFSLARRNDLGANARRGEAGTGVLGRLVAEILADPAGSPVRLSALADYQPAHGSAAFAGTAVYTSEPERRELLGVLVFQLPKSRIAGLFGDGRDNDRSTMLVGDDDMLWSGGMEGRRLGDLTADGDRTVAQSGSGAVTETTLLGRSTLMASVPLAKLGRRWTVVATEDAAAVMRPVWRMIALAVGIGALATALFAAASVKLAARLAAPVLSLMERFDAALSNMQHGLVMIDAQGRMILCNAAYRALYGLPTVLSTPGTPLAVINSFRAAQGMAPIDVQESTLEGGQRRELADGRTVLVVRNALPSGGYVATHQNLTDSVKAEKRITYLATHDALTGLPNRASFESAIAALVQKVETTGCLPVLCLDLDHFKTVNDTLGHPVGDLLLQAVAARLLECLDRRDILTRLGGDEFVILQASAESPEDARRLAHALIERVAEPFDVAGHTLLVGLSVGIAVAPHDGSEAEILIKQADLALYRAKADGRGSARFFEPGMDKDLLARRQMELDLRQALPAGQFEIAYQPVFDARTESVRGVEALLRWRHPLRGMISPADFIPLAEERGLIVAIGEWVLRRACEDGARWPATVSVAVNMSAIQLKAPSILQTVTDALARSGLPPSRLELEITETVLIQDDQASVATLHALKAMGVRIAMDDFGTGYSSLSYLRSFPFDKIKIDRSFVRELGRREDAGAIVKAICDLATTLRMETTAEGVETIDQLAQVRKQGCTLVQGFFFCRPTSAHEVERLLSRSEEDRRVPA